MTDIIILGFFLIILLFIWNKWIWQKIRSKIEFQIKPKIGLILGLFLILTGILVFASSHLIDYPKYVSYQDGRFFYADISGFIGFIFIFIGLVVIIIKWVNPTIEKHATDHGRTVFHGGW